MHFAWAVLAIFHRLPSMKVLDYRLAQANYMDAVIAQCDSVQQFTV